MTLKGGSYSRIWKEKTSSYHILVLLPHRRMKSRNEAGFHLSALNISGSVKRCLEAQVLFGVGISGNGGLAGPALPLSSQNSSAIQKSRGWNSPQGMFGSVLGTKECLWIQQHILKGMAAGQGRAPAVTHESEEKPWAPGESQGSRKETPPECPGLATRFPRDSSQGFGFSPGLFVSPEQFLGAGLISYGKKVFQAVRVG